MTTIDCATCPVRGRHCGDCFVPVLGRMWLTEEEAVDGLPLDAAEQAAVDMLLRVGLVDVHEAHRASASRVLPSWSAVG